MGNCDGTRAGEYKAHYDIIRLIAILLVVFNHTPAFHFPFQSTGESLLVLAMMFVSAFDKVAVPLFFMITGALLLPRQESVSVLLRKRVLRILVVILLFHAIQSAWYLYDGGVNGVGIRSFLGDWYWGSASHGYVLGSVEALAVWFLYAYLGLMLMLPFLRSMAAGMTATHFWYLFGLQIVCGIMIPNLFSIVTGFSTADSGILRYLPLCGNVLIFVLAGYYVEERVDINKLGRKQIGRLVLASAVFVAMAAIMPEVLRQRMQAPLLSQYVPGMTAFMLIPCMTIVIVMKKLCRCQFSRVTASILRALGGAVFTVMLVENILRAVISRYFVEYESSYLPSVWVAGLVCLVGLVLGLLLKRVPVLKTLL